MTGTGGSRRWRAVARIVVSVTALGLVAALLDVRAVGTRLAAMDPAWVAGGLGVSVAQLLLLAWRWRYTAGRLGLDLPLRDALAEYYLGNLLNQLLPGGVTGDVSRAWRHARREEAGGSGEVAERSSEMAGRSAGGGKGPPAQPTGRSGEVAVRAVVLERIASQVVMTSIAVVSLAIVARQGRSVWLAGVGILACFGLLGLALRWRRRRLPAEDVSESAGSAVPTASGTDGPGTDGSATSTDSGPGRRSLWDRSWSDAREALFEKGAFGVQITTSLTLVASYIGVYVIAARAVGVTTPTPILLPLIAPVLMAMLVPVTVAGWGVREGAAAALWATVGLTPEDGVAISVAYGVIVLLSTAPGALVLLGIIGGSRDRRGRRLPSGSGGTTAEGPASDPGSAEG